MPLTTAANNLGRHILYGATEAVRPALIPAELLGQTEVRQHDMTLSVQQDVLQFYVAVYDTELVEKYQNYLSKTSGRPRHRTRGGSYFQTIFNYIRKS